MVLLVLREPGIRNRYAEALVTNGYLVLEAADWPTAVPKALTLAPDALVLEVSLLVPGGTDAARVLKCHERTSHIPILALSDHSWRPSTLRAIGFDRVLRRPCSQAELLDAVGRLFEAQGSLRHGSGS